MLGGDFIGDIAINRAQSESREWESLYRDVESENRQLKAEIEQLRADRQELGEAAAINLALRYALANRLAAVNPFDRLITEPAVAEVLKKRVLLLYNAGATFDDIRGVANEFNVNHTKGYVGMNRDVFIHYAKIGHAWEALNHRISFNKPPQLTVARACQAYLDKLPGLMLQLTGDSGNPVFTEAAEHYISTVAGAEYDRLIKEDFFAKNRHLYPIQIAVQYGQGRSHPYTRSDLDDTALKARNHERGYSPPADLFPSFPPPPSPGHVHGSPDVMGIPRLSAVQESLPLPGKLGAKKDGVPPAPPHLNSPPDYRADPFAS